LSLLNLEAHLNPQQLEAVTTILGPLLVIAGAGSGKTRTIVYRLAYLMDQGIDSSSILLLTFTKKAASSMLQRTSELVGMESNRVRGGTFHGFAHRMLRIYGHLVGLPLNFVILDRTDVQNIFGMLVKEMDLAGKGKRFPSKATLAAMASKLANTGMSVRELIRNEFSHMESEILSIEAVMRGYAQYKQVNGLVDYDDLLLYWLQVLREHSTVREAVGRECQFIMVDEYQDTNRLQAEMVRLVATGHDNVMAVGDDAQSIYAFRGANYRNILDFPNHFPGTKIIVLEKNYRSTQPNLDCANAIIASGEQYFTKRLCAHRPGGVRPLLYGAVDEGDQAIFVANRIEECLQNGIPAHEIAVLFRAAFHSFHLEAELKARSIPFVKRGGQALVEASHIKDLLSLLRMLINPLDRLATTRVLCLIKGLGPKAADRMLAEMLRSEDPWQYMAVGAFKGAWADAVRDLGRLLQDIRSKEDMGLFTAIKLLLEWYRPYLEMHYYDDYPKRLQELQQLLAMSNRYADTMDMLTDLTLEAPDMTQEDAGRVCLSTIHSAKGLEWQAVFLISLCEGRFPSHFAESDQELDEERRLFYVAVTRAKDLLCLSCPAFIYVPGGGNIPVIPSRFLKEIPGELFSVLRYEGLTSGVKERISTGPKFAESRPAVTAALREGVANAYGVGMKVRHSIFGAGLVKRCLGPNKIVVAFDTAGEKTLNTTVAKLTIIDH
jgi:DNA helicase-2/ATP-dependent DNA helicase PcrA